MPAFILSSHMPTSVLSTGTGYYYARFRPGLGSVLIFLALLTSGVQHGVATINRKRDLDRITRLAQQARSVAYGPKGVPLEKGVKRKVRVPVNGSDPAEKNAGGPGRLIDLMVDGTDVYIVCEVTSLESRLFKLMRAYTGRLTRARPS